MGILPLHMLKVGFIIASGIIVLSSYSHFKDFKKEKYFIFT